MKWEENVKGLQHIGIPAADIEKTADFYQKLGFEIALETENQGLKVVFLKNKNIVLETYETDSPALKTGAVDHIAIDVADIEAARVYIAELGLPVIEDITFLPFWANGVKYFIIEGPNKEKLEFAQYL